MSEPLKKVQPPRPPHPQKRREPLPWQLLKSIDEEDPVAQKHAIPLSNIIAIGDSDPDLCMIRFAGIGVAFCSPSELLKSVADYRIEEKKFSRILEFAG